MICGVAAAAASCFLLKNLIAQLLCSPRFARQCELFPDHSPGRTFSLAGKGTKSAPGEYPRSPGIALRAILHLLLIYAPTYRVWVYLSAYPSSAARGAVIRRSAERLARRRKRRLSTHELYRRFLLWHIGAVQVYCASAQRVPDADSTPLRGRQAELVDRQSPRSEPRRELPFTGQSSSSFGSVSENPPPRQAVRQRKRCLGRPREGARGLPGALLVTFPA